MMGVTLRSDRLELMPYFSEIAFSLICLSIVGGAIALPKARKNVPAELWLDAPNWCLRYLYRCSLFFTGWLPLQSLMWMTVSILTKFCDGCLQAETFQILLVVGPTPFAYWLYQRLAVGVRSDG
jgi:hypothetical protein